MLCARGLKDRGSYRVLVVYPRSGLMYGPKLLAARLRSVEHRIIECSKRVWGNELVGRCWQIKNCLV